MASSDPVVQMAEDINHQVARLRTRMKDTQSLGEQLHILRELQDCFRTAARVAKGPKEGYIEAHSQLAELLDSFTQSERTLQSLRALDPILVSPRLQSQVSGLWAEILVSCETVFNAFAFEVHARPREENANSREGSEVGRASGDAEPGSSAGTGDPVQRNEIVALGM